MKILILFLLLLASCGSNKPYIDYRVKEFVDMFSQECKQVDNVSISEMDISVFEQKEGKELVAYCNISNTRFLGKRIDQDKDIYIKHKTFEEFTKEQLEILVYHELGHCVLMREHIDESFENGMPYSIMRQAAFNVNEVEFFKVNREYYIKELCR